MSWDKETKHNQSQPYKRTSDIIQAIGGLDKRVHAFPQGINLKVNIIAGLEFELTYFETIVQQFSHNATDAFGIVVAGFLLHHAPHMIFKPV